VEELGLPLTPRNASPQLSEQRAASKMTVFRKELQARLSGSRKRPRWIFVPYDQMTDRMGPLSREDPADLGIVIVENPWKAARRPYHIQKLALVVTNMRQFALEQAERGVAVKHVLVNGPYRDAFPEIVRETGPIRVMRPAEYELRHDLTSLHENGLLVEIPHEGWLTTPDVLLSSHPKGPPYLLERFYAKPVSAIRC
jgi:deoxyribodipyrimidine photolyase-related protein